MTEENTRKGFAGASVELAGIVKHFGRTLACHGAHFSAQPGRISALVGENGAGKTTLMRVLAGRLRGDAGEITISGTPVRFKSPRDAGTLGIAMVEQESRLIGALSVLENIILGAEETKAGLLSRGAAGRKVEDICRRLGLAVSLDARADTLSPGERSSALIARALYRGAGILILDEPTSLLGSSQRAALFDVMRNLASSGATVIFISHKLGEVFQVADTITVLRKGATVFTRAKDDTSPAEVAGAMVEMAATEEHIERRSGEVAVELQNISTAGGNRVNLRGVWLQLLRGEITGIAGIAGNGQRALADVVGYVVEPESGWLALHPWDLEIRCVGEDVDSMDLAGSMRVWENVCLGREGEFARFYGLDSGKARRRASEMVRGFRITGEPDLPVSALSGGNRQRLVLARELSGKFDVLVAEEPTRGLDIAGAALVRKRLRKAAARGATVLVISYDLDELYALCDRILVIDSGRLVKPSTQLPPREELAELMTR
ncbi:MAG: ATP-binding cassette domain-containing protein [Planctomycetes bacterium]|nr:ATP-binding cassette domain-containing protein [Planctomycetota bacterium]